MLIALTPEQETWLKARAATGGFASIEEAARRLIDERMAEERRLAAGGEREVLLVGELSDADLAEIARTEMAAHHRHLDNELT
jgi:antitoxin ParD1/3/4